MPKLITSLTPAQEARFPEFVRKWTAIGLSTQPADRARAETAIAGLYRLANLKEPRVIWLPCPLSAALATVAYATLRARKVIDKKVRTAVDTAVRTAVRTAVGTAVDTAVRTAVDTAVGFAVGTAVDTAVGFAVGTAVDTAAGTASWARYGGSLWAGYAAWADYFNEVLGISIDRNYLDLVESCGYYWMLDDVCFASERPSRILLDDRGRLHSESGQSIGYPSGWGLWHWHGVQVPQAWIERKTDLTAQTALTWPNIEQRRAACEIVGWSRILRELDTRVIDRDADPEIGELIEVNLPDVGRERFLRVRCGTGREFALPVPPNTKTALAGNAWTYDIPENLLQQKEIRT